MNLVDRRETALIGVSNAMRSQRLNTEQHIQQGLGIIARSHTRLNVPDCVRSHYLSFLQLPANQILWSSSKWVFLQVGLIA